MHNSHFAAKKMKENVLNIEYHGNSLETSSRCVLSIDNNNLSIWAMQRSILDFWKQSLIFAFERKKANSLTFCAKISSRSLDMAKPWLESCSVNPGDGFQYLSSYQNVRCLYQSRFTAPTIYSVKGFGAKYGQNQIFTNVQNWLYIFMPFWFSWIRFCTNKTIYQSRYLSTDDFDFRNDCDDLILIDLTSMFWASAKTAWIGNNKQTTSRIAL